MRLGVCGENQAFNFSAGPPTKRKSLGSEDSRLLELLGRFELPTSSLPNRLPAF